MASADFSHFESPIDRWDRLVGVAFFAFVVGWWTSTAFYKVPHQMIQAQELKTVQTHTVPNLRHELAREKAAKKVKVIVVPMLVKVPDKTPPQP